MESVLRGGSQDTADVHLILTATAAAAQEASVHI